MLTPGPRWLLVGPGFEPRDRQGKYELALVEWIQVALELGDRACRWFAARPMLTFTCWALWLSFLYFALGPASYVKVPDAGNGTLPARMVSAGDLLRGELGNWMAFSGCGTDRVLNNFRLEPLCVLLGVFPGWLGYGLITFVQRLVAGYFFYRLTRDDLKFETSAAILTGLVYAQFHQVGIHWQWDGFTLYDGLGIPGLPLLFWLTNRLVERRWWLATPIGGAIGAMLALSSPYFQSIFFPFLAVFWYTFIQRAWSGKRLLVLTCMFIGWAVLTAPEMLAAARYVPHSHRQDIVVRSDSEYVKYIENVEQWPDTVARSNRVYLAIAIVALLCARLREPRVVITCLAVFGILAFVSHYYDFNDNVLSHLGILSSFHFHRFIYLVPFLCALAMGLGLMALPKETLMTLSNQTTALRLNVHQVSMLAVIGFAVVVSVESNLIRWRRMWYGENFTTLYRNPDLLALAARQESEPDFRVACVTDMWRAKLGMKESHLWTINPGICWAYGLETTDGYQVLYSLRYKQFWSRVIEPLMSKDTYRARQHVYWGNMVYLWHPAEDNHLDMHGDFKDYYNLDLLSLANTRYIVSPKPLEDPDLTLLESEQREEFFKRAKRKNTSRILAALRGEWSHRPIYIYENQRVLPRYYLARSVALYDNRNTLVHDLGFRSAQWLRDNVEVHRDDVPAGIDLEALTDGSLTSCLDSIGEVRVVSRGSDRLELEFEAAQPCVLFLSHSYHPSWQATLDGEQAEILPVNHAFQGVYVPTAGKHRAVFEYRPEYALW